MKFPNKIKKSTSSLAEHKRDGKQLIPPFLQIPNLQFHSWINYRIPEMIWACLMITHLDREIALIHFRNVVDFFSGLQENEQPDDITISSISKLKPEIIENFLDELFFDEEVQYILSPLTLFPDLPGLTHWQKHVGIVSDSERWDMLKYSVLKCYDHQSQESTDCRWLRILYTLITGKLVFEFHPMREEIIFYPEFGDMRQVRPTIRAMELVVNGINGDKDDNDEWKRHFWKECLVNTECEKMEIFMQNGPNTVVLDIDDIKNLFANLINHCNESRSNSGIDAKFDAVFGIAIFCVKLFEETMSHEMITTISGRLCLRSLVECFITLRYLCHKDDPELWLAYRKYSAGQAKLIKEKLDEIGDTPQYINYNMLEYIANQDCWEEFTSINLGNWERTSLRKMSEETGTKKEYDQYYSWTSGYVHGMWGAINESVYDICANPLHRFHNIPKSESPKLNGIASDAIYLINRVLDDVDLMYPSFNQRL